MSRAPGNPAEPITVAPSNNIYTVLAIVGFLVCLIGLIALFLRGSTMGVELLKM